MIAVRCDGNIKIGTGHIMRCISIAKELERAGELVLFICADNDSAQIVISFGFKAEVLHSEWADLEVEIQDLCAFLEQFSIKKILIDSYFVTERYLIEVSKHCKVCYIDDLFSFKYTADMIINYNISHYFFDYKNTYSCKDVLLLLGAEYAPLREEFCNIKPIEIKERVSDVLITTGGTDNFDVCLTLIKDIVKKKEFDNVIFHLVIGRFFLSKSFLELKALSERYPQIVLHENVKSMYDIMKGCDVAISAGGSTIIELCAVGLPFIVFGFADNQDSIVKACQEMKIGLSAGRLRDNANEILGIIVSHLKKIMDCNIRLHLSSNSRQVTDGNGAKRIAEKIKKFV